jgi:hypothetical protein
LRALIAKLSPGGTRPCAESFASFIDELKPRIQMPCRRFEDFEYRARKSWSRARRVVAKPRSSTKGPNPLCGSRRRLRRRARKALRSSCTLREALLPARRNGKPHQGGPAGPLCRPHSTSWMASNQLRLRFSAFAHLMLSVLRAEVLLAPILPRPPSARFDSSSSRLVPESRSVADASTRS